MEKRKGKPVSKNTEQQKLLRRIKVLKKVPEDETIEMEMIEKAIFTMMSKYDISVQPIFVMLNVEGTKLIYSAGIRANGTSWEGTAYGESLYEMMANVAIQMYDNITQGKVRRSGQKKKIQEEKDGS